MASVMLFTFGPGDSFVFFCDTKIVTHRANAAFTATVSSRLGTPYSLTLGPGENEYAAVYLNKKTGRVWRSINYPSTSHLYGIAEILSADDGSVSHPSDGRVSIGGPDRNDNYAYAVVKGGVVSCSSEIAPPTASLTALLDNTAKEPVKDVVLGHGGSWFLQYTDGTYKFDLAGRYQELSQILQSGVTNIQHLALSRYHPEHFFLVYGGNKKVRYSMQAAFESMILPLIQQYHASCRTVSGAVNGDMMESTIDDLPPPYETVPNPKATTL